MIVSDDESYEENIWIGKYKELLARATSNFQYMAHDCGINAECESEIEQMLAFVFFVNERVPWFNECWCQYNVQGYNYPAKFTFDAVRETEFKPNVVYVFPQVSIGRYRVDFLCAVKMHPADGPYQMKYLAVECDGHDFHEKTKQQASRDKLRDRTLLLHGIPCMRFTGSEIWNDAYACMKQVDRFFQAALTDYVGTA